MGALANRPTVRRLLARARQAAARARYVAAMTATVRLKQELGDAAELAFSPTVGSTTPDRRSETRSSCCNGSPPPPPPIASG